MIAKELREARWKILVGSLITILTAGFGVYSFELIRTLAASSNLGEMGGQVQQQLDQMLAEFDTYAWAQWYGKNAPLILGAIAGFLGGGLIAGEVSKGTIFFLLSKPVSRTRVLLAKFTVAAAILLGLNVLGSLVVLAVAALLGHPQPLGGVALGTLLLWLGTLSVTSVALLFSVLFDDVLRPVALALGVAVLVGIPGIVAAFLPEWNTWNLTGYWSSLPAYLGTSFPTKELLVCLVAAVLPVAAAVPLFRSRAY